MNCPACDEAMLEDDYGHPVHDGRCPGQPPNWTEDRMACQHCGSLVLVKAMATHHRSCTPENPKQIKTRARHCPTCLLWHRPLCPGNGAVWPVEPLLELAWTRTPERTNKAAAEAIGIDDALIYRYELSGISDEQADRWVCRLGFHPSLVWPGWFEAAPDPLRDLFMASGWRTAWLHDEIEHLQEPPTAEEQAA